ncbi:MAG TPA: adenosylmethionine--8-amino-7-oxononanoate transaminase [Methylibium sp.]|uniref:adenosylmethionine--8-amino-7-oxononanoate transaminase n=1 Tax=Methylibium sp. TaxID=2067992 RepID=UPI002DB6701D|nr:adenosylmethionine--8-amino-7-oxononanoate transaminase [Methylibium sp.]HEU4458346.1 adenosylmethionine--8-amino-7-oxononanoate transaminase [Methylibium sp.]
MTQRRALHPPSMTTADDLAERSRRAVWHPCTQMKRLETEPLLPIASAEGPWLVGTDGRRYLDAVSSWWVNLFGHGHPAIRGAIEDQLATLDHVMLAGLTHEPVVRLAERLGELTGLGHAFFASDGASATEIALKMSAHAWRNAGKPAKCEFVGLQGGYHGETIGALAVTDIRLFREAYAPLLRLAAVLPSPDTRHALAGEDPRAQAERCAQALERYLAEHEDRTAALIVEPLVQCAAGFGMHDAHYLKLVRQICRRHQVHLICDEIAVGFGRTGTLFAHQQAGIVPDLVCLSKGLTGGTLPLSVVLSSDAVYERFYDDRGVRGFLHSHSYTGNPLACRAALAVLDLFEQGLEGEPVFERNRRSTETLNALTRPLDEHPRVRGRRQLGMLWAWDIDSRGLDGFAGAYHFAAREQGLLLRPIGDTLYFMPPYVCDDAALEQLAEGALAALEAVTAQASGWSVSLR